MNQNSLNIATKEFSITRPDDHPIAKSEKIGVLLINLGTPDSFGYFDVRRYLSEFLSDQRVINYPAIFWQPLLQLIILTSRPFRSGKAYAKIWDKQHNASPLLVHTKSIAKKLADSLADSDNIILDFAMCYGNPSIEKKILSLQEQGCQKILLCALYPQYSATTTAAAYDKCFKILQKMNWQPAIRTMPSWYNNDAYISLLAQSIEKKIAGNEPEFIIASFHGLPQKYLENGDPYHCFCVTTARLVREKLSWPEDRWITCFQSRFGPAQWLQPYADKTVEHLAKNGVKKIALISPAFICECIETLEEICMEMQEDFLEAGGEEFTYIPCLNDSDNNINFLQSLITNELQGWG